MDISLISLIISGVLASIQIINFISGRAMRSEDKLKVFAKSADVRIELDKMNSDNMITGYKVIELDKKMEVLTERVDNEIRMTGKLLDKLDQEVDKLK